MASCASADLRGPTKTLHPRRASRSGSSPAASTIRLRADFERLARAPSVAAAEHRRLAASSREALREVKRHRRLACSADGEIADRDHRHAHLERPGRGR